MLMGAVVGFWVTVATGEPWLGLALAMTPAALLSLLHAVMVITFQADQVVSGLSLTFLGTGLARVMGEGLSKAGRDLAAAEVHAPGRGRCADPGRVRPRPERARLPRLCPRADRLVLDPPDPPGSRAASRGRVPDGCRRRRRRRLSPALRLRPGRRANGRPGRRHDHPGHPARLVRRSDGQRPRLDRDRPGHLRPVEPDQGRDRRLPVRGDLTTAVRPAGAVQLLRDPEPDLRRPLADVLPCRWSPTSWSSWCSSSGRARPRASGWERRRRWVVRSSGANAAPEPETATRPRDRAPAAPSGRSRSCRIRADAATAAPPRCRRSARTRGRHARHPGRACR